MIGSTRQVRVWACAEPTDMRKSYDGLLALALRSLGRDVLAGDLFLFVSRTRHQAKVLFWDGTGLCVFAKRLEQGLFAAPWEGGRSRPWQLTINELQLFLEGSRLVAQVPVSPPPYRWKPHAS